MSKLSLDFKDNGINFTVFADANGNKIYSFSGEADLPIPGFKTGGSISFHFTENQYNQLKSGGFAVAVQKDFGPIALSIDGGAQCEIHPNQRFECALEISANGSVGMDFGASSLGIESNISSCKVNVSGNLPEIMQDDGINTESLEFSTDCTSPLIKKEDYNQIESDVNKAFSMENIFRNFGVDLKQIGLDGLSMNEIKSNSEAMAIIMQSMIEGSEEFQQFLADNGYEPSLLADAEDVINNSSAEGDKRMADALSKPIEAEVNSLTFKQLVEKYQEHLAAQKEAEAVREAEKELSQEEGAGGSVGSAIGGTSFDFFIAGQNEWSEGRTFIFYYATKNEPKKRPPMSTVGLSKSLRSA